ncbi:MAG: hypothetical protein GH151_01525, partial [Bacteroidetes bacterium]|nr:hypothetical protein [Bacteroidota bacterium]
MDYQNYAHIHLVVNIISEFKLFFDSLIVCLQPMPGKNKKILVATTNPGKVAELTAMLDADVKWVSLTDFSDIAEVKEDGLTFTENACKKAVGYAKATDLWTIADDSGLVIDALEGGPGIES